jgi:two-component system cell cycle response regulator DivK
VGEGRIEAVTGPNVVPAADFLGFDGFKATWRIKANPTLTHVPILAMTSYQLNDDDIEVSSSGYHGDVSKAFKPRVLLATVRGFLL